MKQNCYFLQMIIDDNFLQVILEQTNNYAVNFYVIHKQVKNVYLLAGKVLQWMKWKLL